VRQAGRRAIAVRGGRRQRTGVVRCSRPSTRCSHHCGLVNNGRRLERQTRVEQIDAGTRQPRIRDQRDRRVRLRARGRSAGCPRGMVAAGEQSSMFPRARLSSVHRVKYVDYAASKAALDALTVGLSREVAGEGIRVNGCASRDHRHGIHASGGEPGRVARLGPQLPMGRGGHAIEVARAILWLLSDEASYTTGTFHRTSPAADETQLARSGIRTSPEAVHLKGLALARKQ